jgi:hypothetical protein
MSLDHRCEGHHSLDELLESGCRFVIHNQPWRLLVTEVFAGRVIKDWFRGKLREVWRPYR